MRNSTTSSVLPIVFPDSKPCVANRRGYYAMKDVDFMEIPCRYFNQVTGSLVVLSADGYWRGDFFVNGVVGVRSKVRLPHARSIPFLTRCNCIVHYARELRAHLSDSGKAIRPPTIMKRAAIKHLLQDVADFLKLQRCSICGCTENDCEFCTERTGKPCKWVKPDLCSACAAVAKQSTRPASRNRRAVA